MSESGETPVNRHYLKFKQKQEAWAARAKGSQVQSPVPKAVRQRKPRAPVRIGYGSINSEAVKVPEPRARQEPRKQRKKTAEREGHIDFRCDYIDDDKVFKAVCFAISMMRKGTSAGLANYRAAAYYRVSVADVARHTGQHAARKQWHG